MGEPLRPSPNFRRKIIEGVNTLDSVASALHRAIRPRWREKVGLADRVLLTATALHLPAQVQRRNIVTGVPEQLSISANMDQHRSTLVQSTAIHEGVMERIKLRIDIIMQDPSLSEKQKNEKAAGLLRRMESHHKAVKMLGTNIREHTVFPDAK